MKKVGVVGIHLNSLRGKRGTHALTDSGQNFGNMLFTNAAYKQVKNCVHIGFNFDPKNIKEKFDALLIPAANWVNPKEDWGHLARRIEEADLPTITIGLGAQLQSIDDTADVPAGTVKFLQVVSERSHSIAVRGEYTKYILEELGIKNVVSLGCPSIFYDGRMPQLRAGALGSINRIAVGATRYVLPPVTPQNRFNKQRTLYQFALRNAHSIYFQSERFEIGFLNREDCSQNIETAKAYYGISSNQTFESLLLAKGKYHTDLDQWIKDAMKEDLYIGTRIHGTIAATLAGTPAILITHDKRTEELADTMCIPSISIKDFRLEYLYEINAFVKQFDFQKFIQRSAANYQQMAQFYDVNGLEHCFEN